MHLCCRRQAAAPPSPRAMPLRPLNALPRLPPAAVPSRVFRSSEPGRLMAIIAMMDVQPCQAQLSRQSRDTESLGTRTRDRVGPERGPPGAEAAAGPQRKNGGHDGQRSRAGVQRPRGRRPGPQRQRPREWHLPLLPPPPTPVLSFELLKYMKSKFP